MWIETVIQNFHTVLGDILKDENISEDLIHNCDETGISLDLRSAKVVALERPKNVWIATTGDKTNIAVMAAANATGCVLDPLDVFKGKRENLSLKETAPENCWLKFSETGWMMSRVFEMWLEEHFYLVLKENDPILQSLHCFYWWMGTNRMKSCMLTSSPNKRM